MVVAGAEAVVLGQLECIPVVVWSSGKGPLLRTPKISVWQQPRDGEELLDPA